MGVGARRQRIRGVLETGSRMSLQTSGRLADALSWIDSRGHWFAAVFLLAMTLLLYFQALSGWWTYDDPLHLKEAIQYGPDQYFFVPYIWQGYQGGFFTPLLTLSYDLDYSLFGLNPTLFYGHQLASVALAAFAFYLLLSLWVSRSVALLGAMLLLVSPPLALGAHWLAIRHYVEGLALASLAFHAWGMALRRQSAAWCWWGAILYLFAMLAKEVYVPLAGLMMLVPERTWRERLRFSWPLWASLAVYLAWRFWMLGGQFGGYGLLSTNWEAVPDVVIVATLLLPLMYFLKLFGLNWMVPVWIGVLGAMIVVWVRAEPVKRLGLAIAILVLVSMPLVPIATDIRPEAIPQQQRFVIVPAAALIMLLLLGVSRIGSVTKERSFLLIIPILMGAGFLTQSFTILKSWEEPEIQKKEGMFLLERMPEADILAVSSRDTNFFYRGMDWLRAYLGGGKAPTAVYGGYFGLNTDFEIQQLSQRIYRYDPSCQCIRDATSEVISERQKILDHVVKRPLSVSMNWGRGAVAWDLGPYKTGKYFLLAGQRPDWYSGFRKVHTHGSIAYMLEGYMRVVYESPEGWITISPEFHVNLAENGRFDWDVSRSWSAHSGAEVDGRKAVQP